MYNLRIKFNSNLTKDTAVIKTTSYIVNTNGFEAVVVVAEPRKTSPYVSNIQCTTGEHKLNNFEFWKEIQIKTIEFHEKRRSQNLS